MKKPQKIIRAGQNKKRNAGIVNTPVFHASTVIYDSVADRLDAVGLSEKWKSSYQPP